MTGTPPVPAPPATPKGDTAPLAIRAICVPCPWVSEIGCPGLTASREATTALLRPSPGSELKPVSRTATGEAPAKLASVRILAVAASAISTGVGAGGWYR